MHRSFGFASSRSASGSSIGTVDHTLIFRSVVSSTAIMGEEGCELLLWKGSTHQDLLLPISYRPGGPRGRI